MIFFSQKILQWPVSYQEKKNHVKQFPMPNRHQFCLTKPCHVSRSFHETRQNPCFFLKNTRDWILKPTRKTPLLNSLRKSHYISYFIVIGVWRIWKEFPLNKSSLSLSFTPSLSCHWRFLHTGSKNLQKCKILFISIISSSTLYIQYT